MVIKRNRIAAFICGLFLSAGLVFAGLETGTYISDLVATNPLSSDLASTGDDHLRLIKSTVKATFPNINAAVTATDEELNIIDGVTASTAELNHTDGVTSAIQTQLDAKAVRASANTFSAENTFTATGGVNDAAIQVVAADPFVAFDDSGAAADNRWWDMGPLSETFRFRVVNDAISVATTWLSVDRTGTTVDTINLAATDVQVNGVTINVLEGTATTDLGSINDGSRGTTAFALTGTAVGDACAVGASTFPSGLIPICYVNSADNVTVGFANHSGGAIDPSSTTFVVKVFK